VGKLLGERGSRRNLGSLVDDDRVEAGLLERDLELSRDGLGTESRELAIDHDVDPDRGRRIGALGQRR
jgi:hypothetical protein